MIQKIILTGGAGVGKTTILKLLEARGHNVLTESGREVYISEQNKTKEDSNYSPKLPQTSYVEFEERVIQKQLAKERNLSDTKYFLDRSLVDCLGMSIFQGKQLKLDILKLIKEAKYFPKVFLLSPLNIYEKDGQRKETREEMLKMHDILRETYISQGFNVIEIPMISPEERLEYILKELKDVN